MAHLIVFSHLRWDFVFQRPQHLLTRLAQTYPVIYLEEPVKSTGAPSLEVLEVHPDVVVLRPHTPLSVHGFAPEQLTLIRPMLAAYLQAQRVDDTLAWFYTPMALPLLDMLDPSAVIYDCMDELSAFKGAPGGLRQLEQALLKRADVVFTGGISLYQAKRKLHPQVYCQPSAVDVRHYEPARLQADSLHMAAAAGLQGHLSHPMLGYFGVIDERMNLSLVNALALAHPEWSLVMVGPVVKIDPASLPRQPNIHWLGLQPYERLPYLVKDWDICLMPFALNEATHYISPTKTLEYLAAEKPVVSTAIRDVVALYGDVVEVARSKQAFIDACEELLRQTSAERYAQLARASCCVSRWSWDDTSKAMLEIVAHCVEARQASRAALLSEDSEMGELIDVTMRVPVTSAEPKLGSVTQR